MSDFLSCKIVNIVVFRASCILDIECLKYDQKSY